MRLCTAPGCTTKHYAHGYCEKHGRRVRKYGTTTLPLKPTVAERFWSKVDKTGDCWIWTGALGAVGSEDEGYGIFNLGHGEYGRAHRISYVWAGGDLPADVLLDHTCFNKPCVRPEHLRHATNKQNTENHCGARRNSRSGVRGVSWDKAREKWLAQVTQNGRVVYSQRFDSIEAAKVAVVAARNQFHTYNDTDRESA